MTDPDPTAPLRRALHDLAADDPAARRDALELLYARLAPAVHRVAWGLLGSRDAAEDVTQQTFVAVAESAGGYRGSGSPAAWVVTIGANLARRALLRERTGREKATARPPGPAAAADASSGAEAAELRERVAAAMQALPPGQRLAIGLSVVDGLTSREIADLLGCPEGTVWSRIHHARQRLARLLGAFAPDLP